MAVAKLFTGKVVVSDKLNVGSFAPVKGIPSSELIVTDHLPDGVVIEHSADSEAVASDAADVDQPLLMAKADIELSTSAEFAGAVASDADFTYTDHITSDVAELATDQPELVAMNTVQHISDSTVLAEENAAGGGGIPWMWVGAAAVAGGGLGVALGSNHGGNDAAPASGAPVDSTVHVVVERFGAFIDADNDGMKDIDERTAADFSEGGNADLLHDTVTVHFNNVPLNAIDLTGFTEDDKVQFDVGSFQDHHLLNTSSNSITGLEINSENGNDYTYFQFTNDPSISLFRYRLTGSAKGFNNDPHHDMYALQAYSMEKYVNGHDTGVIAFWDDPENALNFQANVLHPLYTNNNTDEIRSNLNDSNATHGQVEFIWPADEEHVDVIVDSGDCYIDRDGNGILNSSDYMSGTVVYQDATFESGGNADLASKDVTIHFHDAPNTPLDLSGFTANDMIEIDMIAWYNNTNNITRHHQTTINTVPADINNVNVFAATRYVPLRTAFVYTNPSSLLVGSASLGVGVGSYVLAEFGTYNPLTSGNVVFVAPILE